LQRLQQGFSHKHRFSNLQSFENTRQSQQKRQAQQKSTMEPAKPARISGRSQNGTSRSRSYGFAHVTKPFVFNAPAVVVVLVMLTVTVSELNIASTVVVCSSPSLSAPSASTSSSPSSPMALVVVDALSSICGGVVVNMSAGALQSVSMTKLAVPMPMLETRLKLVFASSVSLLVIGPGLGENMLAFVSLLVFGFVPLVFGCGVVLPIGCSSSFQSSRPLK
jgi:hypothetical protein